MDARKVAVAQTGVLHLHNADDNEMFDETGKGAPGDEGYAPGKPITVTLYGPGSKQYANAQTISNNKAVDKLKKRGKTDQTTEQRVKENADFLSACTQGFSDNFTYGELTGKQLIHAIYSDPELGFINDQVQKFLNDWGNFSKASPTP